MSKIPLLSKEKISTMIRPRAANSHKGDYGHALLIAGNKGRMGAAVMCAEACLRTGVGLVTVNIPEAERAILQSCVPEAMLMMREEDNTTYDIFSAIGIGPALGITGSSLQRLKSFLHNYKRSLLMDADALNLLSQDKEMLSLVPSNTIITPHPKEFDRMFGEFKTEEARRKKAVSLSLKYPWVIVLKGHQTLIAHNGNAYLNTTGNAGLAKGGSGDVLSGMITALLAQGYNSFDAAQIGVFLHGTAADLALNYQSEESMLARDVIAEIGAAFKELRIKRY